VAPGGFVVTGVVQEGVEAKEAAHPEFLSVWILDNVD
jgi:hypothetical protein